MTIFSKLGRIRHFEKTHLPFLVTLEDFDIVRLIGAKQEQGESLLLKQLFLEGVGSIATVTRRLHRLRHEGIVLAEPLASDRRSTALAISPSTHRVYLQYAQLLDSLAGMGAGAHLQDIGGK